MNSPISKANSKTPQSGVVQSASRTGKCALWILATPCLLLAPSAHAHLVQSGFGAFYDGAIHFAVSPEDVLVVLALSLYAGFCGRAQARALVYALPAAWLVGAAAAIFLPPMAWLRLLTILGFGVTGLLLALNLQLPERPFWAMAAGLGLLHGLANGMGLHETDSRPVMLLGIATAIFVATSLLSALVSTFKAQPLRIATRVAGSWMAAICMLMLAWFVKTAS